MTDILIVGVDNDLGVSGWVCPIFVCPQVQGCHVDVFDLFVFASNVMQFDGIGATPEEGVSGLKWFNEFEGVEEVTELGVGLDFLVPVAFPHDFNVVPSLSQGLLFVLSGLVDFWEGTVRVTDGMPVTLTRKACATPMSKTSVEFVHGGALSDGIAGVEPVHQVPVLHAHFTPVSSGTDAITRGRVLLT